MYVREVQVVRALAAMKGKTMVKTNKKQTHFSLQNKGVCLAASLVYMHHPAPRLPFIRRWHCDVN